MLSIDAAQGVRRGAARPLTCARTCSSGRGDLWRAPITICVAHFHLLAAKTAAKAQRADWLWRSQASFAAEPCKKLRVRGRAYSSIGALRATCLTLFGVRSLQPASPPPMAGVAERGKEQ